MWPSLSLENIKPKANVNNSIVCPWTCSSKLFIDGTTCSIVQQLDLKIYYFHMKTFAIAVELLFQIIHSRISNHGTKVTELGARSDLNFVLLIHNFARQSVVDQLANLSNLIIETFFGRAMFNFNSNFLHFMSFIQLSVKRDER